MNGPCLCGDPGCWHCGDPIGEKLRDELYELLHKHPSVAALDDEVIEALLESHVVWQGRWVSASNHSAFRN